MIRGLMLARLDRLDDARDAFQRGLRGAERWGMADAVPVFHYQLGFTNFLRGRLDDALAEVSTHDRLAAGTDIGWFIPTFSLKALIALHQDDLLAAERHVAVAEREAAAGAPPFATDLMVLARALLLEATGDAAAGLAVIAGTFDAMAAAGAATFLPVLGCDYARLAVVAGEPARAEGVPGTLEAIAALNQGVASLEAYPLRARGLLAGDADALVAAERGLGASGRVLEAARAAEDAAAAVGGDAARGLLGGARATYERSGAAHDLARVDGALRALGVRRGAGGPRRRPQSGWEALTDTELKVVRLVAERLTNPEIAERMFISRRTVQTHVSHALAKLGVASRRDLAAEAARRAGWRLRVESAGEQPQEPEPAVEAPPAAAVDGHDA
jgi:DNA-binding CsgD family transcriptional regulator